jgi:hypothetical protein
MALGTLVRYAADATFVSTFLACMKAILTTEIKTESIDNDMLRVGLKNYLLLGEYVVDQASATATNYPDYFAKRK